MYNKHIGYLVNNLTNSGKSLRKLTVNNHNNPQKTNGFSVTIYDNTFGYQKRANTILKHE